MSQAGGDWVLRMLAELSGGGERAGQQRHLLHLLAHAHLQGRHLLLGNPVPLPLLGRLCIFQVRWSFHMVHTCELHPSGPPYAAGC